MYLCIDITHPCSIRKYAIKLSLDTREMSFIVPCSIVLQLIRYLTATQMNRQTNLTRDGVPKATQLFAINEKWLLVKCMKRFFVCVCVILASDIVSYKI